MTRKHYTSLLLFLLVLVIVAISFLSAKFDYELAFSSLWTSINVLLMMMAGGIFLLLLRAFRYSFNAQHFYNHHSDKKSLYLIIAIGLFLRLVFLPSQPILEDDFYRYFFDGSLIVHSQNPYKNKPADAYTQRKKGIIEDIVIEAKPELEYLHHIDNFSRVAYPHIKTIYPLVAQAVFAFSGELKEFDLAVWRSVLIGIELMSLLLFIKLLSLMSLPKLWVSVYWLNPLVISEGINAAHMDVILVPFLLLTLLCIKLKRYKLAAVSLSLAVGVKIWPLLLVPVFTAFIKKQKGDAVIFLTLTIALSCAMFIPQIVAIDSDAGIVKYAQHWQVNSFLFNVLYTPLAWVSSNSDFVLFDAGRIARSISALIIGSSALLLSRCLLTSNKTITLVKLSEYLLWAAVILFLLSPTGYPWYCFWFFPFLPFALNTRTWPILLLVITLPLYDLRYIAQDSNNQVVWQWVLVTATFLPVILGLVIANKVVNRRVDVQKANAKIQP